MSISECPSIQVTIVFREEYKTASRLYNRPAERFFISTANGTIKAIKIFSLSALVLEF